MIYRRFFWLTLITFVILLIALSSTIFAVSFFDKTFIWNLMVSTTVAIGFGSYLAIRLARPLERLKERVDLVAAGKLNEVVDLSRNEISEIHDIGKLMDQIAAQLIQRIDIIQRQKDEQEAVLTSMEEGLIAVDRRRLVTLFNPAAARLFRVHREQVVGKNIAEIIRVPQLLDLVERGLDSEKGAEEDLEILGDPKRYIRMHLSPLRNRTGDPYGVVLVVSDVTRIRELEGMRKNFVANVSHELRTPLTSIQGFAETLMNPQVTEPSEIKRFVEIIQRHANRLGRIIEDILTLSRIEKDAENSQIETKDENFDEVIDAAYELCEVKAKSKGIVLAKSLNSQARVNCDRYLIEQTVVNLIDNAIRYSDSGKPVTLRSYVRDGRAYLEIEDQGMGIASKHLPRIFERFYRVDRARSRELGGTGLGLSIVKHIVTAHKGQIDVKSKLGEGTTFIVSLGLSISP